jgi:hypothetical protein
MSHYIFLKSLRSLEEFRKNSHIKIPHKSPCANFHSPCKFNNLIFFQKEFFFIFRPSRPNGPIWPFSPLDPPILFFLLHLCWPSAATFACRRTMATASPSFRAMERPQRSPPPPLNNSTPSSIGCNHPLLHFGNGSIEDPIYRRRPTYSGCLRPLPTL